MVTGEFYTKKEHFPGFGRPYVFNAEILLKFVSSLTTPQKFAPNFYCHFFHLFLLPFFLCVYFIGLVASQKLKMLRGGL